MMKYVAIIDTGEYKDFKFFEDGCGEYLVARDENAQSDEWIRLPFVKAETVLNIPKGVTNGDMIQALFPDIEIYDSKVVEIKKMTFEEVKEMFKKSIDTTDNMNQAIESLVQSVYLKGYNDAYPNAKYKS